LSFIDDLAKRQSIATKAHKIRDEGVMVTHSTHPELGPNRKQEFPRDTEQNVGQSKETANPSIFDSMRNRRQVPRKVYRKILLYDRV
jgi:hypothetical protein